MKHSDSSRQALLPRTSWLKLCVIPIAILYLYSGQRSVQDIVSFVISLSAILSNMLAHTFMRHAQYAKNTEQSKLATLLASICFALSASIFLILNVYASHYSSRYLFSQLVPQSINACLAITRVFNIFSHILDKCFACTGIRPLTTRLVQHPGIAWWCRIQQAVYRHFAQRMIYYLRTGHQFISDVRQHGELRAVSIIPATGVRKSTVEMIESKLALACGKYTPIQKFTQYFRPSDITRLAVVCLAALLLSIIDRNFNILSILFSVSLCTFAASQTIDRQ